MLTHLIIVEYNLSNKLGAEGAKLHIYLDRLTFRVPLRRQRLKAPAMEGAPASVHRLLFMFVTYKEDRNGCLGDRYGDTSTHTAVVDESSQSSHAFPVFIMEVLLYRLSRGSRSLSRDLTPPFSERDLHIFQPETRLRLDRYWRRKTVGEVDYDHTAYYVEPFDSGTSSSLTPRSIL